jgi:ATP-dependent DNA ligase
MLYRVRPRPPPGFIQPCLPTRADKAPSSVNWIHEIKHDGFRMMVGRDAAGVRLRTRNGIDWTTRFPLIAEAAAGIVSKRLGSPYRSGRSNDWLKSKNPDAPAAKREAEEDWGR